MMATRGINEMYVYGGALYNAVPPPSGSFVARVEPGSLKELWRTNLINTNISGIWTGGGSIESIGGDIFAITHGIYSTLTALLELSREYYHYLQGQVHQVIVTLTGWMAGQMAL